MARRKSRSGGGARTRRRSVEEAVESPPTSPTSEPTKSVEIVFGKDVRPAFDKDVRPAAVRDEQPRKSTDAAENNHSTDWQALLATVSGSSMFEETPEQVLGVDPRAFKDAVAPFMCKEMQAMWGPPNAGWIPQRPVSPTNTLQQAQEKMCTQQQEQEQLQQQLLLRQQQQQQHDAYCFYQQQQQQQQQQLYYQQQQQQMIMMSPMSPVMAMAQYRVAASA